jgi:hypothetical protein
MITKEQALQVQRRTAEYESDIRSGAGEQGHLSGRIKGIHECIAMLGLAKEYDRLVGRPVELPRPVLMMAKAYAHKGLTDMKRRDQETWSLIRVRGKTPHPDLGECWTGSFVEGVGAFDVHFPMDAARPCTRDEKERYLKTVFGSTFAPSFRLEESEFA